MRYDRTIAAIPTASTSPACAAGLSSRNLMAVVMAPAASSAVSTIGIIDTPPGGRPRFFNAVRAARCRKSGTSMFHVSLSKKSAISSRENQVN